MSITDLSYLFSISYASLKLGKEPFNPRNAERTPWVESFYSLLLALITRLALYIDSSELIVRASWIGIQLGSGNPSMVSSL